MSNTINQMLTFNCYIQDSFLEAIIMLIKAKRTHCYFKFKFSLNIVMYLVFYNHLSVEILTVIFISFDFRIGVYMRHNYTEHQDSDFNEFYPSCSNVYQWMFACARSNISYFVYSYRFIHNSGYDCRYKHVYTWM